MPFLVLNLVITALRILQFIGCVWMFAEFNDDHYLVSLGLLGGVFVIEMASLILRVIATAVLVGLLL